MARERDPYLVIMRAAARGVGVSLSAREVRQLSLDSAVSDAAINGLSDDEASAISSPDDWANVRVHRVPAGVALPAKEQPNG
jgi:lysozyme family protein